MFERITPGPDRQITPRVALLTSGTIVLLMAAAWPIMIAAQHWVDQKAQEDTDRIATMRLITNSGLIASELQKFRLLPLVLVDYPDVNAALDQGTSADIDRLNQRFKLLADRTNAAAIYLLNRDGITIASSNWQSADSFIGHNYKFRPYFTHAVRNTSAEQFALGTVTNRPGLFLAQLTRGGKGVVVIKIEFGRIEREWMWQSGTTFVRDTNGVIIISSRPEWRLRATQPLSQELLEETRHTRPYGDTVPPLLSIPLGDTVTDGDGTMQRSLLKTSTVPVKRWTLSVMEPLAPAQKAAEAQLRYVALAAGICFLLVVGLFLRSREKRQLAAAASRALEEKVRERTTDLRQANERLVLQQAERERNEARLRAAREELARANRLGTLGQVTASVAHEINQPVSAIGTFAENALVMTDRGQLTGARENLSRIVDLTKRIGEITSELRLFARRENPRAPMRLSDAVDGSLLLMHDRLRNVKLHLHGPFADIRLIADRVRLEQVIINLLQNAADALDEVTDDPTIWLTARESEDAIEISVRDNGPGISPDCRDHLFTPFVTGKAKGLGLGLPICLDIVRDFGGELRHGEPPGGGAEFIITLRKP